MIFSTFDFDKMRDFLWNCGGKISERENRIQMFDIFRYSEDYENIYSMIEWYGSKII